MIAFVKKKGKASVKFKTKFKYINTPLIFKS